MKFRYRSTIYILILICTLLLCGCGSVSAPPVESTPSPMPEPPQQDGMKTVVVSNADEFLAAIDSDTMIWMKAGRYDLTEAMDYAAMRPFNKNLSWEYYADGYELSINRVKNLSIVGESRGSVELLTRPRYAHILRFADCENVSVSSITMGHTEGGQCTGGVIAFDNVCGAGIADAELFGCGIRGITASHSRFIYAENSVIRDCSDQAAQIVSCEDVRFMDCEIYGCGSEWPMPLFDISASDGFELANCKIHDNSSSALVGSVFCRNAYILSSEITKNAFENIFDIRGFDICVDGCSFTANDYGSWFAADEGYGAGPVCGAKNLNDHTLSWKELSEMELRDTGFVMPRREENSVERIENADGLYEVHVDTVNDFLAAIAPNTIIYLDGYTFRLDEATDYGVLGSGYYSWEECYDGFELNINGVSGLKIIGTKIGTEIQGSSRWANILRFNDCTDVEIAGIKAGHVEGMGTCSGGVVMLERCTNVRITDCRLYGCGIMGINADGCSALIVSGTEIYDCSDRAAFISSCGDVHFRDCLVHDCGLPNIVVYDSYGVFYNDIGLEEPLYDIDKNGNPVPVEYAVG